LIGAATLLSILVVCSVEFGIKSRLLVSGNAAATASNILANQTLFRINLVGDLVYCAGVILVACGLYVVLKPVGETLALIATVFRLVFALMWLLVAYNMPIALRFVRGAAYLKPIDTNQLQALARFYLNGYDAYYIGLVFWAAASAICGYLWLKSRYIPAWLAIVGVVSSIWCAACTVGLLIYPDLPNYVNLWWFDAPMTLFEIVLAFLLVFKGVRS
jgi:uncharacterized protein DUF4386